MAQLTNQPSHGNLVISDAVRYDTDRVVPEAQSPAAEPESAHEEVHSAAPRQVETKSSATSHQPCQATTRQRHAFQ